MKNKITKAFFLSVILAIFGSCTNDELTPYYDQRKREIGKVAIHGYNASNDSIQMTVNGKLIEIGKDKNNTAFVKKIEKDYDFVFFNDEVKTLVITNKKTSQILGTYLFTNQTPSSALYFYAKEDLFIDDVSFLKAGTLTQTGTAGFKFLFPSLNKYSGSSYQGTLDGIITKSNGQVLGTVKNISKDAPSDFIEFPFSTPAAIKMELVKHGTKESYITGQKVIVALTMTNNKSKQIILEEKQDANGKFSGVEGVINLADFFTF